MASDSSKVWSVFSLGSALLGAAVAKKVLNTSWKAATGKQPPANPADPDVALWEAVTWAAASGTFVALARMLATRRAASYYARSTGHLPPGLGADAAEKPSLTKEPSKKPTKQSTRQSTRAKKKRAKEASPVG
jgi:hypothetical protein